MQPVRKNIIGSKLRRLRRAQGLSVADLAARLGGRHELDAGALRAIESQTRRVRDHEVLALARALGVRVGELLPARPRRTLR